MTTRCTGKDIPQGNPFGIGATPPPSQGEFFTILTPHAAPQLAARGGGLFHVLSRGEALNVIGNLIVLGDLSADEIDETIRIHEGQATPRVRSDGTRVLLQLHPPPILMRRDAALQLIAAIVARAEIQPSEIDAAVERIQAQTGRMTLDDVAPDPVAKPN